MTTRRATRNARRRASRPGHALPYAMAYREPWRRFTPFQRQVLRSLQAANRSLRAGLAAIAPRLRQALDRMADQGAGPVFLMATPQGRDVAAFRDAWRALMATHRPRLETMTAARPDAWQEPADLPPWKPYPYE